MVNDCCIGRLSPLVAEEKGEPPVELGWVPGLLELSRGLLNNSKTFFSKPLLVTFFPSDALEIGLTEPAEPERNPPVRGDDELETESAVNADGILLG